MLIDYEMIICDTLDIGGVTSASTVVPGDLNILDFGQAGRGEGELIRIYGVMTEAGDGGTGAATLTFTVETDDDTTFATSNVIMHSVTRVTDDLAIGTVVPLGTVPRKDLLQYLGVRVVTVGTTNAGMIGIYCVIDEQAAIV